MNAPKEPAGNVPHPTRALRTWPIHLAILAVYTLLALVFSYPLVLRPGDSIAGVQGDVWSYLWAMGWAKAATFDLGINPFRSNYVYYPLGGATQLLWATALPSFASIPLQLAFGLIPAFNIIYVAATVLTAYGTCLLALYVLGETSRYYSAPIGRAEEEENRGFGGGRFTSQPPASVNVLVGEASSIARTATYPTSRGGEHSLSRGLAAFVGGAAFAFSALRLGYGVAFTNLFHTELIPFYLLFLFKTRNEPRWRNPILAGILLGLNVYIDFQLAAFLILFTALLALLSIADWSWHRRVQITSFFGRLIVAAIVSLLAAAPMIAIVTQDLEAEGGNYVRVYPLKYSAVRSYDVLSYLLPNARSSLYQIFPAPQVAGVNAKVNVEGESQLSPDHQSYIGLVVIALAVLGAASRPRALALWIAAALAFCVLSFGPTLHFAGVDLGIPLPYAALHELPIVNNIRIPMRYGLMTFLAAAILAASGAEVLATRGRAVLLTAFLAVLILGEAAVLPYPTLAFSVPHFYQTIADEPGVFTVLEIPTFNWRAAAANEVFQVYHQKRILRAYTNRISPDLADYFSLRQTALVVRSLRILEGAEDGTITPDELDQDRSAASAEIELFDIRYAVLHRDWLDPANADAIDKYLREVLGARRFAQEGSMWAYEIPRPPVTPSNHAMAVQSDAALMYLGRGWQTEPLADVDGERGRYVTGDTSELYFYGNDCDCTAAHFLFRAYSQKGEDVLEFILNGKDVGTAPLVKGWADYDLSLSSGWLQAGLESMLVLHSNPQENQIAFGRFEIR